MYLSPYNWELSEFAVQPFVRETYDTEPVAEAQPPVHVTLRDLNKYYGERHVLKGLNIEFAPGEFAAIVGRSGCGKSTLLRLLAGLESATPAAGQRGGSTAIRFDGEVQDGADDRVRMMFQDPRLLPWKSILDNVAIGTPIRQRGEAASVLRQVGLGERGGEWPAALSGGQKQRVALARALLHRPGLLLLDEPLGALDALTRLEMQQLIEDLWLRDGFTAVLVTHDVNEAIALADRVIVIDEGNVILDQRVALPRPRQRTSTAFAALEARVLDAVLNKKGPHAAPAACLSTSRLARRSDSPGTEQSAGTVPCPGSSPTGAPFVLGRPGDKKDPTPVDTRPLAQVISIGHLRLAV